MAMFDLLVTFDMHREQGLQEAARKWLKARYKTKWLTSTTYWIESEESPKEFGSLFWDSKDDETGKRFFDTGDRLMVFLLPVATDQTEAYENNPRYRPT